MASANEKQPSPYPSPRVPGEGTSQVPAICDGPEKFGFGVSWVVAVASALVVVWHPINAHAYIDLAPTLGRIISDSRQIAVVEVTRFDRDKHEVEFKEIESLKGDPSSQPLVQDVAPADGPVIPRQILRWAAPGARAVLFSSRATALVCLGDSWYQVKTTGNGIWKLGADRPDLPLAYDGGVAHLADSVKLILAGDDAVITVVAYGADDQGASFDLALNRQDLPGLARLQRIRANQKMPQMVAGASGNPAYFVGAGAVDVDDLPAMISRLASTDATVRAEAAADLRLLGKAAASAMGALQKQLDDADPAARFAAAAAILRISQDQTPAMGILAAGLGSTDAIIRRRAAQAAGMAGSAAAGLVEPLAALLSDSDYSVRIAALESISLLGSSAGSAAAKVIPLLDDRELCIDAADALGRMGLPGRAAMGRLALMLKSDQDSVRWAGARAMSEIGGPESHPAVEFMINALPKATEVQGYNMMIYFSLLGPDAIDAKETIQSTRIKNPVLPSSTVWALAPDKQFPWQGGGGSGGFGMGRGAPGGGPGGRGPGGGGGPADIGTLIYESYVRELGPRLHNAAVALAREIVAGTAGKVPDWGYRMLSCGSTDVLAILMPHLADKDQTLRERAAVALGNMGPAANAAAGQIASAVTSASTERERRLMQWALGEAQSQ